MTKFYLSFIFIALLFANVGFSQNDLDIQLTHSTPVIDGEIDQLWLNTPSVPLNSILVGSGFSATDFSASFKTVWDLNYLYFLVEVNDESQINDSGGTVWQDDAIEIYIDINNDKLTTYGETDYQYSFRWNDNALHTGAPQEGVEFKLVGTKKGYLLEVKFPWKTLKLAEAKPGVILGLDVHVHDDDDGGDRDAKISWKATIDQSYQNPSLFATVSLAGEFKVVNKTDKPLISVDRGFYNQPFDCTISSSIFGMQIKYTLDGSDPKTSATAKTATSSVTVRIDPSSKNSRGKTPAVVLRAVAKKENYDYSEITTRTYLFIDRVKNQTEYPGHDWPSGSFVNDQEIDLLIDTDIVEDERYTHLLDDALMQIPTFSIVTDNANLFDPTTGIYVNAWGNRGQEWERPASIELLNPDGSKGFQIDAGLRIRGGWSRHGYFRKHAFRLFFREEYGDSKLNFPLFGKEGVDKFDKIDLRCSQNYSWSKGEGETPYCTFNRDVFSRDLQREMGQEYTRSRYYHLYVNGLYWGMYQTQERSESSFAASYMGGNASDYDVIKHTGGESGIEANDGTMDAWKEVWDLCVAGLDKSANYNTLQGLNSKGERDESKRILVDVDNLIDYMNVIFYSGNFDGPYSSFSNDANNFYAIFKRNGSEGFQFFAHDNEHTLLMDRINVGSGLKEDRVNFGSKGDSKRNMNTNSLESFQPQWLHYKLTKNEEYRIRFADRAYELYYNNGILTPEKTAELFYSRTLEYDTALIAESARWGDVDNESRNYTKDDDWIPMIQRTMNEWFPQRTNILIEQLKYGKLLPELEAPEFRINNELLKVSDIQMAAGSSFIIRNANGSGSIKYTVDGSDPRVKGGTVSASAVDGGNITALSIIQNTIIKARIYNKGEWSALHYLKINVAKVPSGLQITDIHYNPVNGNGLSGSEYEFVELKNSGTIAINLTASAFKGIQYTFYKDKVIQPGEFIVLASSRYAFNLRYGFEPYDEFEGQLDNGGERISLIGVAGDTIVSVKYNDKSPWPSVADGLGFSIVPSTSNLLADWDDGNNWRASAVVNGSPGADDAAVELEEILVNEVLANSEYPLVDAIELFNPNPVAVNVGNWYLTDDIDQPKKWQIPSGTSISANSFVVFNEGHYVGTVLDTTSNKAEFGSAFSLSSHGDKVILLSANASGDLTGFENSYDFGDSESGVTIGRHIISTGNDHFVAMAKSTLGGLNSLPKVGPVVINQIMYHPLDDDFEFLELKNISAEAIEFYEKTSLIPWKVSGIAYQFPKKFILPSNSSVYLIEAAVSPSDFRYRNNLDTTIAVFNYSGKLNNGGEEIVLSKSAPQYMDKDTLKSPYVVVDKVKYNDNSIWPDADGNGYVLKRKSLNVYGNDPANWTAELPAIAINNYPLANAIVGVPYLFQVKASGGSTPFTWTIVNGSLPIGISLNSANGKLSGIATEKGLYTFTLKVSDALGSTSEISFTLTVAENSVPVAIEDRLTTSMNIGVNSSVLKNDIDSDGDLNSCELSISKQPVNGVVFINNDLSISYIPNKGFMGMDTLTYKITDVNGFSEAKVIIEVLNEVVISSFEMQISQSSDDAEEHGTTNKVTLNSDQLELFWDLSSSGYQLVGLRFQNINLPKGTEISSAYIQFTSGMPTDYETVIYVLGETIDNASTFTVASKAITSRSATQSYVEWWPKPWLVRGEASELQRTPDIGNLVQEILDRDGWVQNNSMAFLLTGGGLRVADSYDKNPKTAPLLHIEYISTEGEPEVPVANAGVNQTSILNNAVVLDGSQSYSPDGRLLNYQWEMVSLPDGSSAKLNNSFAQQPGFIPDVFGNYQITLKVNNGHFESNTDTITVIVKDEKPIANAGSDQTRIVGADIKLNGSASSDPENGYLSYQWTFVEKPVGSGTVLTNATSVQPRFKADVIGLYTLQLIVFDGLNYSDPDMVSIQVNENKRPIAIAGNSLTVYTGAKVNFDASGSYDPEEMTLTYSWTIQSKPSGSKVELLNSALKKPSLIVDLEGEYVLQLVVFDGVSYSEISAVTITVLKNTAPVAKAGSDQELTKVEFVYLDGSASFDPDATEISYLWTFVTKPVGSEVNLKDAQLAKASFAPDAKGLYTLRLMVSDGILTSSDDVQIIVNSTTLVYSIDLDRTIKVYPNPFFGTLNLDFDAVAEEELEIELYNISGALIEKKQFNGKNISNLELNFDNKMLRNGMYLLKVNTPSSASKVFRLIYQEKK